MKWRNGVPTCSLSTCTTESLSYREEKGGGGGRDRGRKRGKLRKK